MREKTVACACLLWLCFGLSAFALGSDSATISIDGVIHTVSTQKIENTAPILIVKDEFILPDGISRVTVSPTLNESYNLKCLILSSAGPSDFILSGEMEFSFPSGTKLSMFGKTVTKNLANGVSEGSVTFMQGLDELKMSSSSLRDGSIVMAEVFSKKGFIKRFQIPGSFFRRLLPRE